MPFNFSEIEGIRIAGETADEVKAPTPVDAIPQERFTGDVLRGYGPRRGNLERLLRYWRPIMRKPGGFRRCRVILANHPELYPLERICAWLHHETTGLWPNEGCHHPGMKNCRRKIRGVVRGSLYSDSEFNDRMQRLRRLQAGKKEDGSAYVFDNDDVVTASDMMHASSVMRDFVEMEPKFCSFLRDDSNWIHEGMNDDGEWVEHDWSKPNDEKDCGCN